METFEPRPRKYLAKIPVTVAKTQTYRIPLFFVLSSCFLFLVWLDFPGLLFLIDKQPSRNPVTAVHRVADQSVASLPSNADNVTGDKVTGRTDQSPARNADIPNIVAGTQRYRPSEPDLPTVLETVGTVEQRQGNDTTGTADAVPTVVRPALRESTVTAGDADDEGFPEELLPNPVLPEDAAVLDDSNTPIIVSSTSVMSKTVRVSAPRQDNDLDHTAILLQNADVVTEKWDPIPESSQSSKKQPSLAIMATTALQPGTVEVPPVTSGLVLAAQTFPNLETPPAPQLGGVAGTNPNGSVSTSEGVGFSKSPANSGIAVIVHRNNHDQFGLDELRDIYLDKRITWSDGAAIALYDLPLQNSARELFSRRVLRMSALDAATLKSNRSIINQPANLARTKQDNLVITYVARNPNAVGYVPLAAVKQNSDVRILLTIE